MKTLNLIQGTPDWAAHRAAHLNASDAPAMLGVSPYKTRAALLREIATGIAVEVDSVTQRRFDDGHRFEALARPLAEQIIGEELFPCVGVSDCGRYSASFDGLTLAGDTAFEHKTLNDDLRACMRDTGNGWDLPKHYQTQMEHQLLVSGAERVLFMASKWNGDDLIEERHCWYASDPSLRAEIIAGWEQFAADVAAYDHVEKAEPAAVGRAPDALPALRIEVTGMVTASNLIEFKAHAMAVLDSINRDLQTDEDFANAEQTVKWCKGVEDRLEAAKANALAQTASIDDLFRTIDSVSAETRKIRLELDKLVTREKESRKAEIVAAARAAVQAHYDAINATMGAHALSVPASLTATIGAAIKGKRTLATIRDAADDAAAQAKIDASQVADRTRACMAVLDEFKDHAALFADRVQLCATKAPDDLRNLARARVAEHQERESARLEQERERIRQEEAERLAREQAAAQQQSRGEEASAAAEPTSQAVPPAAEPATMAGAAPMPAGARIKLGDINCWIAPLSVTAAGLASLGFKPVGHRGAAHLYAAVDFPAICTALAKVLASAPARASEEEKEHDHA